MRICLATTILLLSVSSPGLSVSDSTDQLNTRVQRLEMEVLQLRQENVALSAKLAEIQKLVSERLPPIAGAADAEQGTCQQRIEKLGKERENLKKLGLQDRHPDVSRITAKIQTISSECEVGQTQR
ncbi:hypothetical protein [Kordiimonas aestuarii]|uniref:hypothetical protein n=1 Tax=Kordiimonas aestuarii TaxID=1005925 RepID=UPI0021D16788|nr:hypothetical protein [Kordiimonas aestuarii]